jgi:hypothetical protein
MYRYIIKLNNVKNYKIKSDLFYSIMLMLMLIIMINNVFNMRGYGVYIKFNYILLYLCIDR